mgnify:CR=1 FL=1
MNQNTHVLRMRILDEKPISQIQNFFAVCCIKIIRTNIYYVIIGKEIILQINFTSNKPHHQHHGKVLHFVFKKKSKKYVVTATTTKIIYILH